MDKKQKRKVNPFITAGAVLLLAALALYVYNAIDSRRAGQAADALLDGVQAQIEARTESAAGEAPEAEAAEATPVPEMPVIELDGNEYIGYISVPSQGIELPVMSDWSYDRLKIAPCRQFGSYYTDDLVIAAHNFDTHFGRLKYLSPGDSVVFTDAAGGVHSYAVTRLETVQPDDVSAVQNSGHDLVLYTCTLGGKPRVTVFCDREDAES